MYQVKGYFLLRNTAPKTPTIISPTSPSKITVPQNIQKLLNMNCKSSNIPISSLLRFPKSIIDKVLRRICTVCLSYYRPVSNGMVFQPQSDLHRYTGDVPFPALRTTHFILRFPTGETPPIRVILFFDRAVTAVLIICLQGLLNSLIMRSCFSDLVIYYLHRRKFR